MVPLFFCLWLEQNWKWPNETSFILRLVPRPHYYARPMRFGSRGPRKFLRPRARSIQPKFQPVRPGKVVHLKRWNRFFETFPVGPNRSIEFWTEISGYFCSIDRAQSLTWDGAFGRAVNNFSALMKDVQQSWRVQRIKS